MQSSAVGDDVRTIDLDLRPKLIWRALGPLSLVVIAAGATTGPPWPNVLFAAGIAGALTLKAWRGRIVVIEPTVWKRSLLGAWEAVDLSRMAAVTGTPGTHGQFTLSVSDVDRNGFTMEAHFWDPRWRILFGYVAKWAEHAQRENPQFSGDRRAMRRVQQNRSLVT